MVNIKVMRQKALSFPGSTEVPHFDKTSFRVRNKIFATYDGKNNKACLKLSATDQDVFSTYDKTMIYPVPNKWGKQGWTIVDLDIVREDLFLDALQTAYDTVALKKVPPKIK